VISYLFDVLLLSWVLFFFFLRRWLGRDTYLLFTGCLLGLALYLFFSMVQDRISSRIICYWLYI